MSHAQPPVSTPLRSLRCCALWLALVASIPAAHATPATRIASINLCADQLLLLLAPRSRIASVSPLALDPLYSAYADRARGIPVNHARAEELVSLAPDLILAYEYSDRHLVRLLRRIGYRVEVIAAPTDLTGVTDTIEAVARLLDEPATGLRLANSLRQQLATLRHSAPLQGPLAVIYAPGGYSPGSASLPGAVLRAAGFRNLSAELGNTHGASLPLEQLLRAQPDLIIIDDDEPNKHSLAQHKLQHPALQGGLAAATTVRLAGRHWSCPTPQAIAAATALRAYL